MSLTSNKSTSYHGGFERCSAIGIMNSWEEKMRGQPQPSSPFSPPIYSIRPIDQSNNLTNGRRIPQNLFPLFEAFVRED